MTTIQSRAAALVLDAFLDYNARFSDITRRARRRFERRDWKYVQVDATARIDLYDVCVRETLDGYSNFAKSYEQHLVNARKYQRALNARGIYR